jgi:hypothetical protein
MQLSSDWAAAHTLHSCTRGLRRLAIPHIFYGLPIYSTAAQRKGVKANEGKACTGRHAS